jgi:hypothetical protein
MQVIKGTNVLPSAIGVEYCSLPYHSLNFAILLMGIVSIYHYRKMMLEDEALKESLSYDFSRDTKISTIIDETVKYSLFAGFLGGLVGLGIRILKKNTLFFRRRCHPDAIVV